MSFHEAKITKWLDDNTVVLEVVYIDGRVEEWICEIVSTPPVFPHSFQPIKKQIISF